MAVTDEQLQVSVEAFDKWMDLAQALQVDALKLLKLMDDSPDCQTLRRAFTRSAWAYKEGCINGMAGWVSTVENLVNDKHPKRPAERTSTLERIKETLKWCSTHRLTPGWYPDFSGSGWQAVQTSNEVRDRLMHPKSAQALILLTDDMKIIREGLMWFIATVRDLTLQAQERAKASTQ